MATNTFTPHVGGVARSVESFTAEYRRLGHRVLVASPTFEHVPDDETDVVRFPSLEHFNGSDFSVPMPVPGLLDSRLAEMPPDVVHAHHPFLLGDTALRVAAARNVPIVFTHHTLYDQYVHYLGGESAMLQRLAVELATGYCNLCDGVIAPSESVAAMLREQGVIVPIEVIPTGVDLNRFARGSKADGKRFRREAGIPDDAFVVGHVGRLAPEKNLAFLAEAVASFLDRAPHAWFLVVGSGPMDETIRDVLSAHGVADRLHLCGSLTGEQLTNAYRALDVFAFASQTETQGMVLTEAMAASVPVVAVDGPGVREVVRDAENGRLIPQPDAAEFAAALDWIAELNPQSRDELEYHAAATAAAFALPRCAARALAFYQQMRSGKRSARSLDDGTWSAALRWLDKEWKIITHHARAVGGRACNHRDFNVERVESMIAMLKKKLARFRRAVSRNEWVVRWMRLSRGAASVGTPPPGLLLIQIDGLGRSQLLRALKKRRMPFLRKLLRKRGYRLGTMYSGLPSSTPAVQAELFYGVRGAVPAFSFRDRSTRQIVRMFDTFPAAMVQARLQEKATGLLSGGSAYSDVYSGGAAEPHFCAATMGWGAMLRATNPLALAGAVLWNGFSILRTAALMLVEFWLALMDFVTGRFPRLALLRELRLIPSRVFVGVGLRELNTVCGSLDVTRGLPIVHVNFLGYDEQSHRRGPSSAFAHWSLEGIDDAIKRLWSAARRSERRRYSIWIYSDHGQERTTPYTRKYGRTVEDAIALVFGQEVVSEGANQALSAQGEQASRAQWLGGRAGERLVRPIKKTKKRRRPRRAENQSAVDPLAGLSGMKRPRVEVAAMGPIGHVYPEERIPADRLPQIARALVLTARIPMVLTATLPDQARVWTRSGVFELPAQAEEVLGVDHPFLHEAARDLVALCHHADAGQLIICGWSLDRSPVSFALENGGHAGPGPEETTAFALLPADFSPVDSKRPFLRPCELRAAALRLLARTETSVVPDVGVPTALTPGAVAANGPSSLDVSTAADAPVSG